MTTYCDCGAPVSDDYARVFAGNDGRLKACPQCRTLRDIKEGAAATEIDTGGKHVAGGDD